MYLCSDRDMVPLFHLDAPSLIIAAMGHRDTTPEYVPHSNPPSSSACTKAEKKAHGENVSPENGVRREASSEMGCITKPSAKRAVKVR